MMVIQIWNSLWYDNESRIRHGILKPLAHKQGGVVSRQYWARVDALIRQGVRFP